MIKWDHSYLLNVTGFQPCLTELWLLQSEPPSKTDNLYSINPMYRMESYLRNPYKVKNWRQMTRGETERRLETVGKSGEGPKLADGNKWMSPGRKCSREAR